MNKHKNKDKSSSSNSKELCIPVVVKRFEESDGLWNYTESKLSPTRNLIALLSKDGNVIIYDLVKNGIRRNNQQNNGKKNVEEDSSSSCLIPNFMISEVLEFEWLGPFFNQDMGLPFSILVTTNRSGLTTFHVFDGSDRIIDNKDVSQSAVIDKTKMSIILPKVKKGFVISVDVNIKQLREILPKPTAAGSSTGKDLY